MDLCGILGSAGFSSGVLIRLTTYSNFHNVSDNVSDSYIFRLLQCFEDLDAEGDDD